MKLKEFKNTMEWKAANCVEYVDEDGVEIEPTTEVKRRKMNNMEVIRHEMKIINGLSVLEVVLDKR